MESINMEFFYEMLYFSFLFCCFFTLIFYEHLGKNDLSPMYFDMLGLSIMFVFGLVFFQLDFTNQYFLMEYEIDDLDYE